MTDTERLDILLSPYKPHSPARRGGYEIPRIVQLYFSSDDDGYPRPLTDPILTREQLDAAIKRAQV